MACTLGVQHPLDFETAEHIYTHKDFVQKKKTIDGSIEYIIIWLKSEIYVLYVYIFMVSTNNIILFFFHETKTKKKHLINLSYWTTEQQRQPQHQQQLFYVQM